MSQICNLPFRFDLASILTRANSAWHPKPQPGGTDAEDAAMAAEEGVTWPVEGITGSVEEGGSGPSAAAAKLPVGAAVDSAGIMTNGTIGFKRESTLLGSLLV